MSMWDRIMGQAQARQQADATSDDLATELGGPGQKPLTVNVGERLTAPSERGDGAAPRGLVAAAAAVTTSQARAISQARQKWQRDAWIYRDAIGEIRYGMRFLANASSMITLLGAEVGPDGEEPVDLDSSTLPAQLIADVRAIVDDLTGGRGGGHLLGPGVENFECVGECYLLGRVIVAENGEQVRQWSIRSRDEIEVKPDAIYLKTGERGTGTALEEDAEVIRLWAPHPRFTEWADAPMRALLDPCEELLLVTRSVRAAARNRLAGNGLLLMAAGLAYGPPAATADGRVQGQQGQGSTFAEDLQRTMITPISDESSAAAVVPPIVWGEPDDLVAVRHLTFDRPLDAKLVEREERALRRIATGLDVPVEVITGLADVNHWTAWQIDDSSFRHHVAPIVGTFVDSLTVGYLRPALLRLGHSWDDVRRVMLWRDPARLVQRPNRAQDALNAWDRNALSDDSLLTALGFDDTDKPDEGELLSRLALRRGAMDGAITETLLRLGFGPVIDVLRTTPPGQISAHTGINVQDSERANPPAALPAGTGAADDPAPGSSSEDTGDDAGDDDTGTPGSPIGDPQATVAAAADGPAVTDRSRRLSRRLTQVNRSLFDRLIVAADDALEQALTRAGNRIRGKANGTEHAATVRGVQAPLVASTIGRAVVAASLGLEETELLADTFAGLRTKFDAWTVDATEEAFDVVAELLGLDRSSVQVQRAVGELRDAFEESRAAAWALLEQGLTQQATDLLYDPDPSHDEFGEVPSTTVRPGLIRGALAVAGGLDAVSTGGVLPSGLAAVAGSSLNGLTSGQHLTRYLHANGAEVEEYEWTYGISARPFPPHKALDGVIFGDFTDPQLSTGRFPGYSWVGPSLVPGDHDGCHCDAGLIFTDGSNTRQAAQEIGDAAYREQNPGRPLPTRRATTDPNLFLEE